MATTRGLKADRAELLSRIERLEQAVAELVAALQPPVKKAAPKPVEK